MVRTSILRAGIDATAAVTGARQFQRSANLIIRSAGAITAALGFADLVSTISEYEAALVSLQNIAIRADEPIEQQIRNRRQLEQVTRELGATTRFTATQAAEGATALARAGFEVNEVVGALPSTLALAQTEMLSLERASQITGTTLATFELEASQTNEVVDSLGITSRRSATNVAELAEGLKFAAPNAAALGVPLNEVNAALGVLANRGLRGTLAGTGLRRVLQDMGPAIRQYGLLPTLRALSNEIETLEDAQAIFGRRAASVGLILSDNVSDFEELTRAIEANAGETERLKAATDQTLEGQLLALQSAWQELLITIGESGILGVLKDLVDVGTTFFRNMASGLGALFDWISGTDDWAEGLKEVGQNMLGVEKGIRGIQNAQQAADAQDRLREFLRVQRQEGRTSVPLTSLGGVGFSRGELTQIIGPGGPLAGLGQQILGDFAQGAPGRIRGGIVGSPDVQMQRMIDALQGVTDPDQWRAIFEIMGDEAGEAFFGRVEVPLSELADLFALRGQQLNFVSSQLGPPEAQATPSVADLGLGGGGGLGAYRIRADQFSDQFVGGAFDSLRQAAATRDWSAFADSLLNSVSRSMLEAATRPLQEVLTDAFHTFLVDLGTGVFSEGAGTIEQRRRSAAGASER